MKEDRYIVTAEWDDGDASDEKGFEVVDYCETKSDALMAAINWARANFADYSRAWDSWARVDVYELEGYEPTDADGDVLHLSTSDFYEEA